MMMEKLLGGIAEGTKDLIMEKLLGIIAGGTRLSDYGDNTWNCIQSS